MSGIDKTLLFIAVLDTVFVIAMVAVFCMYQSVPDSLIIAVFGATFGECGCCSYIWKNKRLRNENSSGGNDNINQSDDTMYRVMEVIENE